jgi:hypothetical protein
MLVIYYILIICQYLPLPPTPQDFVSRGLPIVYLRREVILLKKVTIAIKNRVKTDLGLQVLALYLLFLVPIFFSDPCLLRQRRSASARGFCRL